MRKEIFRSNQNENGELFFGFEIGDEYDSRNPLIIDEGLNLTVDSSGEAFITGLSNSTNFPITSGAFQTVFAGIFDVFVTKLNVTGTALVYSTFLGRSGDDAGFGIAVDNAEDAYVVG